MKFPLFVLCCLPSLVLTAQQLPLFAQYRNASGLINPASLNAQYLLYEYDLNFSTSYRANWWEQRGTPRTVQASGEYVSDFGNNVEWLVGGTLVQDQAGPLGLSAGYLRLGTIVGKDPYYEALVIGFAAGFVQYDFNLSEINWLDPADPDVASLDEAISKPDVGLGIFYHRRLGGRQGTNNVYFGLSLPQVLNARYELARGNGVRAYLDRRRHYYFTGGWYHFFNQETFLEISSWAKYVRGAPVNVDFNARFQPGRVVWFGLGYNLNTILHLETGLNVVGLMGENTNLQLGFAFDQSFRALGYDLGGSFEFTLGLQFATR
mgnify:CR=1 FL=1